MISFKELKYARTVVLHIIAWVLYILIGTAQRFFTPGFNINVLDIIFTMLPIVYVFYLNYVILTKFLSTRQYFWLVITEILLFFTAALLYYITGYIIGPIINKQDEVPVFLHQDSILMCLTLFSPCCRLYTCFI